MRFVALSGRRVEERVSFIVVWRAETEKSVFDEESLWPKEVETVD